MMAKSFRYIIARLLSVVAVLQWTSLGFLQGVVGSSWAWIPTPPRHEDLGCNRRRQRRRLCPAVVVDAASRVHRQREVDDFQWNLFSTFHDGDQNDKTNRRRQQQQQQQWQQQDSGGGPNTETIRIRNPTYREMGFVANTIMRCFYEKVSPSSPMKPLYRLSELNRVQQNFPYDMEKHRMFVAVTDGPFDTDKVIAFCDIDARPPNRPTAYRYNPRPYLSDLCVDPDFQRRGIAQSLVLACEQFCDQELDRTEIFIRVERDNQAALGMYQKLGYQQHFHPDETNSNDIIMLRKNLKAGAEKQSANRELV